MELGPEAHILIITIFLFQNLPKCSACSGSRLGENGAKAFAGGMRDSSGNLAAAADKAAAELANSVKSSTKELSDSIDRGAADAADAVRRMSDGISDLAQSVDLRVNSGDLRYMGEAASENLKDAVSELANRWDVALKSADMKDFGAEAARHLGVALQNINVQANFMFGINDNVVTAVGHITTAVGYMSIALGIAFSVCFIAIVVSLKSCRGCTAKLCSICCGACCNCRKSDSASEQDEKDVIIVVPEEENKFLKNKGNDENINLGNKNNVGRPNSLIDYAKYIEIHNFWKQIDEKHSQLLTKPLNQYFWTDRWKSETETEHSIIISENVD